MVNTKKALQKLWKGTCTISVYQEVTNPVTKITSFKDEIVFENLPCRLSFETVNVANPVGTATQVSQSIKLFLDPVIAVPPGSKITVTQNGVTVDYKQSGQPAIYTNHQEIALVLFEGWA